MRDQSDFNDDLVDFLQSKGKMLLRFSISLAVDELVGEEVFQKVVVDSYGKLRKVAPEAWFSYIRSGIINQHRTSWRNKKSQTDLSELSQFPGYQQDATTRLTIEKILSQMDSHIREAIVSRYVMGYSISETAEILGTNEMQVKNFCRKGLSILRNEIVESTQDRGISNV